MSPCLLTSSRLELPRCSLRLVPAACKGGNVEVTHRPGGDQTALWNGTSGRAWAELQDSLDAMFHPFEALLAEAVPAGSASRVLDVGCGAGSTTLAAARRLGPGGYGLGIDISEPLITAASAR